ncbi:hypothetical protein ABC955_15255 [Citromicrobium bathyomarinum]
MRRRLLSPRRRRRTEVEIDMIAGRFIVDGIDRYAEIMAIIAN